jgi:rod shape-determining protein MreC
MMRDRNARRRTIVFAGLVAVCLVLIAVSRTTPVQELRRGLTFAVAPVQDTLVEGTRSVTDVLGAFGEIESLRRENLDLLATVRMLEEQVASLESVSDTNRRLSRLLEVRDRVEFKTVVAGVISRQATQFERVLTIDHGSESGIRDGAPVLSEGGALAGRVIDVGEGWASVMLISDTRSLVIGLDSRTRATGEVTGRLSAPLAMANIPRTEGIEVNDRVVTAGLSVGRRFQSAFPRGLPIGRVVDVQAEPGAIVQTALVQPTADLEHIEDVLVLADYGSRRRDQDDASPAPDDAEVEEAAADAAGAADSAQVEGDGGGAS